MNMEVKAIAITFGLIALPMIGFCPSREIAYGKNRARRAYPQPDLDPENCQGISNKTRKISGPGARIKS